MVNPIKLITVFSAGSLKVPLEEIIEKYRTVKPDICFHLEYAGSIDCVKKVVNFGKKPDLVLSADYTVLEKFILPNFASWYINFAKNQMVIVFTEKSREQEKLVDTPWYEILTNSEVKFGRTDKDKDPAGYRALMVWQLAEKHYQKQKLYDMLNQKCADSIFSGTSAMLDALNQGMIDYGFEYLSVALQHKLKYSVLPPEIDLSSTEHTSFYRQARVISAGKEQIAQPIINALTIPEVSINKENAEEFVEFLLGLEGQNILSKYGQTVIVPPQLIGKKPNLTTLLIRN